MSVLDFGYCSEITLTEIGDFHRAGQVGILSVVDLLTSRLARDMQQEAHCDSTTAGLAAS